jgi:hypothetical protein
MPGLNDATQQFHELFNVLAADVLQLRSLLGSTDSPGLRRQLRTAMAASEGIVYALKQVALGVHTDGQYRFLPGEVARLAEESFDVDDKGQLVVRPANFNSLKNIRFAFSAMAKRHDTSYILPVCSTKEVWQQRWDESRNTEARHALRGGSSPRPLLPLTGEEYIVAPRPARIRDICSHPRRGPSSLSLASDATSSRTLGHMAPFALRCRCPHRRWPSWPCPRRVRRLTYATEPRRQAESPCNGDAFDTRYEGPR